MIPVAAGHLGYWYTNSQRVLHQDKFFVLLVNTDFSGGGGGGGSVPNQAPSVSAGPDVTGDEGSAVLLAGSASDLETTPSQSWSYTVGPDVDAGATCSFGRSQSAATKITCTDDGTYTVTLTANDGVNPAVSDSATVRVRNVAPRMAGVGVDPWSTYRAGTAVPVNGLFTDPGSNDTHTCRITWDDGGQIEEFAAQNGSCSRSHTYAHAGMYTIKTTVTDDDGGVGQAQTMVVVYDPDGGFATQGGFLDSPAGALTADPQQSSRLNIQFNVQYKPSETGPVPGGGKVAAQLAGTNFELDSTALEWLVVTPGGRVAVKGSGTVNGEEGYGFVAYGDDAQDSVRLVVWPLSSGRIPGFETVYDNRSEGDYDLDLRPTRADGRKPNRSQLTTPMVAAGRRRPPPSPRRSMPEHRPTRRYEVSPYVEFRMFQLSDTINVGAPLAEIDRSGNSLIVGGTNGVLFRSAGNNFYPSVLLELWASEPPPDPGTWDRLEQSDFDSQDGTVQLMSVMASFAGEEIRLPHPGAYEVRAYCRGREQATALPATSVDHHGTEEWLVQIWPTRPPDAPETL